MAAFESTTIDLCERFGEKKVSEGLLAINGAWKLLYSILDETGIDVDIQEVTAHLGLSSLDDVRIMLRERQLSDRLGLPPARFAVYEDTPV